MSGTSNTTVQTFVITADPPRKKCGLIWKVWLNGQSMWVACDQPFNHQYTENPTPCMSKEGAVCGN